MIPPEAGGVRCLERRQEEEEEDKTGEGKEIGREEQQMLALTNGEMYWMYHLSQNCAPY